MKHKIDIKGRISQNDDRDVMEYWGLEYTCPADVHKAIDGIADGDDVDIYINSGGGEVFAGSEIYTAIRELDQRANVTIKITGLAASAASFIAMAAHSQISPTAQIMIHCVSTIAAGNHNDMEKAAEELKEADRALCRAYMDKTGMQEEEALALMESETWMSATRAVELGLVDEIMFAEAEESEPLELVASVNYASVADLRAEMNRRIKADQRRRELDLLALTHR